MGGIGPQARIVPFGCDAAVEAAPLHVRTDLDHRAVTPVGVRRFGANAKDRGFADHIIVPVDEAPHRTGLANVHVIP